jgi:hypothetical protein
MSAIRVNDNLVTEPPQIAEHIVHYFQSLFCSNIDALQDEALIDMMSFLLSLMIALMLC